jgi:predicted PurR-regulated permease PerM
MVTPADDGGRLLRRVFTAAVLLGVVWTIWLILQPMLAAVAWAAFLSFLLQPLQQRLTVRFGNRPNAAAGVITGVTPIAIVAPLVLIGLAFAQQISALLGSMQDNPELWSLAHWQDPETHPRIAALSGWVQQRFNISTDEIRGYVFGGLQDSARTLASMSGAMFVKASGGFLRFFLMLFILFFMLRDGPQWLARVARLLPLAEPRRQALFERLGKVTRAVVYGAGLTAALQGLLVGIGFAMAGLPGPVVFGVIAAVAALLPFAGAALVWLPGALFLLGNGQFGWGIFMLVWGGVVSTSDNFIRPVIISRYTPVPTLLVFLGVIGGVSAFGFIGFIFGPVILVLATELLRFAEGTLTLAEPP